MKHMKWWGWGEEGIAFRYDDKPAFAAFIKNAIDIDITTSSVAAADLGSLPVPESSAPRDLVRLLQSLLGSGNVRETTLDRVVHSYGKGLRDLVRIRRGDWGHLPDVVVYPGSEEEIAGIVKLALTHNLVVIPFGGGTNISGSLEAPRTETRPVISV